MAKIFTLEDHPAFQGVDPEAWKSARERDTYAQKEGRLQDKGWSREEWLSYVYYLVLQQIAQLKLKVETMPDSELDGMIKEFEAHAKHVMTPPSQRHYFNKNVSA